MQKQGDITGKTLHIDGYVQFPDSLHLNNTQTALNTSGTVGDAGIWFADNTSRGLIAESGKNRMVEIWNHGTMTVSNSHMDLSGFAAVTGGSDANPFIVLNNGMITQDTSNYGVAGCAIENGVMSNGASSITIGDLQSDEGRANNGISVESGTLAINTDRLGFDVPNAAVGLKAAAGTEVTISSPTFLLHGPAPNYTGLQLDGTLEGQQYRHQHYDGCRCSHGRFRFGCTERQQLQDKRYPVRRPEQRRDLDPDWRYL